MTAAFTVILPHRRNPGNDAALAVCMDCLLANTFNDFHLLMDAAVDEPLYPRVNRMMAQAQTEACVYWSSDMFAAPGWDAPMMDLFAADTFVTCVLVEPGAIGVYPENFKRDFGRKPSTFDRQAFENYAETAEVPDGEGWYAPVVYPRAGYLQMGGLRENADTDHHGFSSGDVELFDKWKAAGNRIVRARSYVYHLQRYSQEDEQMHEKRDL